MSSQKFIRGNRIAQRLCCCLFISLLTLLTLGQASAKDRVAYFHNDALGSPVAATDEAGNVLWREEYAPYGQRLLKQDNGSNTLWYTGKEEEKELGIQYFGARWYDPSIGRFLAMDPVGFQEGNIQSYNKYAYANNNPYKYVDPDGRSPLLVIRGLIAVGKIAKNFLFKGARLGVKQAKSGAGKATKGGGEVAKKLSKVKKSKKTEQIGDKFTKTTEVRPGKGPGQSRAEYTRYKNQDGKVIRTYKDSYDRGNKYQGRKSLRGGPEGRSQ